MVRSEWQWCLTRLARWNEETGKAERVANVGAKKKIKKEPRDRKDNRNQKGKDYLKAMAEPSEVGSGVEGLSNEVFNHVVVAGQSEGIG